ncbi:MAG: AgmX/PglI C-terminal domain-containing protein [Nannocystaceae bacterium]
MPRPDRAPARRSRSLRPWRGTGGAALVALVAACVANPDKKPEDDAAVASERGPTALPTRGYRLVDDDVDRRAPFSLTASDGTGLALKSMTARAVVDEPLAFTELHLVFENPTDRQIEGRFEIDMPPGAAISRFSMKVRGAWQEGEVVERQAARVAYEDFLHRRQDPALLENNAGNSFSARVFPIAAHERKELIVSYSQELRSSGDPYRLMLRGLPILESLDASVIVREVGGDGAPASNLGGAAVQTRVVEVKKSNYMPDRDLEVASSRPPMVVGLRHDNLALARVTAVGDMPPAVVGSLTVLFDTSASRALGFDRDIARLSELLSALRERSGEDFDLKIIAFDQTREAIYSGKVSGLDKVALGRLASRRPLGASDLEAALREVASQGGGGRLLIVSDGVMTAGNKELAGLTAATRALKEAGFRRADAILGAGIQDESALKTVTTADLPEDGVVLDSRLPRDTLAHKLGSATLPEVKVEVPGAAWVWPETLEGVQPGDEVLVYADLPPERAMTVILKGEATIEQTPAITATERPLLERAWVRARIERLQAERSRLPEGDGDMREALKKTIIELSTKHRVLSDFTALLVLETEWDYQRFNIDRNALADILTVGPSGVALNGRRSGPSGPLAGTTTKSPEPEAKAPVDADLARQFQGAAFAIGDDDGPGLIGPSGGGGSGPGYGAAPAPAPAADEVWGGLQGTAVGESFGVGGLGLVGTGRGGGGTGEGTIGLGNTGLIGRGGSGSGYGRGAGAGFGGRGALIPTVRQARAEVQGSLDKDIIRRIVRAHINEIRHCYNQTLSRDPNARARVAIHFTIDSKGAVPSSVVQESTAADHALGTCMANAIKRWKFPKPPGGGTVLVTYPFVLEPGDGAPPPMYRDPMAGEAIDPRQPTPDEVEARRTEESPYTGKLYDVDKLLKSGDTRGALDLAHNWRDEAPGDVLALVALGEAAEAAGDRVTAARAYGSIIDLFPARADLRRYAGNRLERLQGEGLPLAIDTYQKAAESRPDHPSSHRLLAFALAKAGRHREAFEAMVKGLEQAYPSGRFAGVDRILRDDLGLLGAAWIRADKDARSTVDAALTRFGAKLATRASTRFVINWETDANDVDFHVHDSKGGHAYFSNRTLSSGGELYADVTTGYGPECFTIPGKPTAFPYNLEAHYYSRGPMGYGMGKLEILQHDGAGELRFDERPFLIMKDQAYVQLGKLEKPL